MARLKFEDIDEWTPSSISIVDVPAHPLCQFEIYDDDEEFVKKSIDINGEIMVEQNPQEEQMVSGPVSFFKDLLNRNVGKADEKPPVEPPKENPVDDISELKARIEKLEKEVDELKKTDESKEEKQKEDDENLASGAVAKSDDAPEDKSEEKPVENIVENAVSKSLDPDMISSETSEKSLLERAGRNSNGMTW